MVLKVPLTPVPTAVRAPITTTATSARMNPYSAMPWPFCPFLKPCSVCRACMSVCSIVAMMSFSSVSDSLYVRDIEPLQFAGDGVKRPGDAAAKNGQRADDNQGYERN